MTLVEIAAALDNLGIEPSDIADDGTVIGFRVDRLPEVMQALGGPGGHLDRARVYLDDWGDGPEIMIEMPSVSFSAVHAAYLAPSSSQARSRRLRARSRFERRDVV